MKKIITPAPECWNELCQRPVQHSNDLSQLAREVFDAVAATGDEAIKKYITQFEGYIPSALELDPATVKRSADQVPAALQEAIRLAAGNISRFHESQRENRIRVETMPGVRCWRESRPVERVGIYIPGGSAPLFSTVLMLAIPAQLAGCRDLVLCTPADENGNVHPAILYAAGLCGIKKIFAVGGIQAIAGMALGTETIPRVDKIFGPGNQYVTAAKTYAQSLGTAIDLPAGPSEVLVIANKTAVPAFVAADLLSQAEHGPDSQVILVSDCDALIDATLEELKQQLDRLPRKSIAAKALDNSLAILLPSVADCISFSNAYAPEHLIIAMDDAGSHITDVSNVGSVFLGHYSCESAGDYASGTNHTLPTNGAARGYSGVSLDSFLKQISFQQISREGLAALGPTIMLMAEAEGLQAHGEAVRIRLSRDQQTTIPEQQLLQPRSLEQLVRPNIARLSPYTSGRDSLLTDLICLDANESPDSAATPYNRYPDPDQKALKAKISALKSLPADQLFIGNGSDEIIDLCFRVFCRPGIDKAITFGPTFSMYQVSAQLNDIRLEALPMDDHFQPDPALLACFRTDDTAKLLLLCSPNNPTGNSFDRLEALVQNFRGITLIDEAYIDFSERPSFLEKLAAYPNAIVCQTFSKARALAGARVGIAFADKAIIRLLNAVRMPYNISSLNQSAALASLEETDLFRQRKEAIPAAREKVTAALAANKLVVRVYPSDANFILVQVTDAPLCCRALRQQNILVRDQSSVLPGCIRISIGSKDENAQLIRAFETLSKQTTL